MSIAAPDLEIRFTGDDAATQAAAQPAAAASPQPAAPAATTAPQTPVATGLPTFEKAPVTKTEIKISGACTVDTRDEVTVSLDDRLRVCGEFRVTKVNHYVDPKTGDVIRQHVIAPIDDLELVPWNAADPNDDGIVRARP